MNEESVSYLPVTQHDPATHDSPAVQGIGDRKQIRISGPQDIVEARQKGRIMTQEIGCTPTQSTLVATAISELARNIILYAEHGEITLVKIAGDGKVGLQIIATDKGPGIQNIARAMINGFSTSGGLGLGLPSLKQIADSFTITSKPGQGVRVDMLMWLGDKSGQVKA
ncbi:MAG: ATP-binding protein [Pseudohongiella sp.]|uniref:ATP-binding protein n=1 Tax=Pseudohongiella sp. TaxID=1979412 RepID=UPI0034A08A37